MLLSPPANALTGRHQQFQQQQQQQQHQHQQQQQQQQYLKHCSNYHDKNQHYMYNNGSTTAKTASSSLSSTTTTTSSSNNSISNNSNNSNSNKNSNNSNSSNNVNSHNAGLGTGGGYAGCNSNNIRKASLPVRATTTAAAAISSAERAPANTKRRSSGFLRALVHESKDVLFAPFHPNRRKASAAAAAAGEIKLANDKGTQTRPSEYAFCCLHGGPITGLYCNGSYGSRLNSATPTPPGTSSSQAQNGTAGAPGLQLQPCQHCCHMMQKMRRSSRARSDPSTRCSHMNFSSLSALAAAAAAANGTRSSAGGRVTSVSQQFLSRSGSYASTTEPEGSDGCRPSNGTASSHHDLRSDGAYQNGGQSNGGSNNNLHGSSSVAFSGSSATLPWQQALGEFGKGGEAGGGVYASPQSRTLPARLEPSCLLSPDWTYTSSAGHTAAGLHVSSGLHQNSYPQLSPFKRSTSSMSSGQASPLLSACCCHNEVSSRFTATSSNPSEQNLPDEQKLQVMSDVLMSSYRTFIEPLVSEMLRYPWGRDSLWLMAFVMFASTLVLLGYVITTVLPTLLLAVCLAICKSLVFRRGETVSHLRELAASLRYSLFTRECIQSLRSATLQLLNQTLQLVVPPVTVPAGVSQLQPRS